MLQNMQTGNVSRIYADLLKLQTLYMRETITAGIVILPTSKAARSFGGNVASLEWCYHDYIAA